MSARTATALALAILAAGCGPVTSIPSTGMFSLTGREPGKVDLAQQGRVAWWEMGGGAIHVEPFASRQLSIPISVTAMSPLSVSARLGLRHRVSDRFGIGFGVTGVPVWGQWEDCDGDGNHCSGKYTLGGGGVDVEIASGRRWRRFELTWSLRAFGVGLKAFDRDEAGVLGGLSTEFNFAAWVHRDLGLTWGFQGFMFGPYAFGGGWPLGFSGTFNFGFFWRIERWWGRSASPRRSAAPGGR